MSLENALFLWNWPTAFGLLLIGLLLGSLVMPLAWPIRTIRQIAPPAGAALIIMLTFGLAFFGFLLVFRLASGLENAERAFGTFLQWCVFATSAAVGLKLRT